MATDIGNAAQRVYESFEPDFQFMVQSIAEHMAELCESPIEVMLATSLILANRVTGNKFFEVIIHEKPPETEALFYVYPQHQWEGYRIDFCLISAKLDQKLFVECDGHEFHERTPEQAERDRRKDRLAQEHGIPMLRFTGREIFRSPESCAQQIMTFAFNRANPKRDDK